MKKTIYLLAIIFLAVACGKNADLVTRDEPNETEELLAAEAALKGLPLEGNYQRNIPDYLKILGMQQHATNNLKAGLGRVLFYDKNLSADRTVSCASCHKQNKAFSDDVAFSIGIQGRQTTRNSMPLSNVAHFSSHYSPINGHTPLLFWDERTNSVETQARQTFANPDEMGIEMHEVVSRIKEQNYYPYLWKQVYGDFNVTEDQVLECIAEFVGAIGSHNSKLDRALVQVSGNINFSSTTTDTIITFAYYGQQPTDTTITTTTIGLPGFSASENRGRDIFVANCSKCHSPIRPFQEVFAAWNGLEEEYPDQGLGALTGNPADNGVFKSPSLRNIILTAPYMHDGRFKTLHEVVNFYSDGVKNHPNLHPLMLHNGDPNLHLSTQEKHDLLAFLNTLTDLDIASDANFSNPFR
jgi:cytochrome c peroxidase